MIASRYGAVGCSSGAAGAVTASSGVIAMPRSLVARRARVGLEPCAHEPVEIAVEHALGAADLEVGAVVLDHRVRVQDVGADLRAEVDVLRLAALARYLLLALALLELDQPRAQHRHRGRAIGRLRALVLALHDDARRLVRDPHRGVRLVDVLAAGAGGPVGVDLQVVVLDLHVAGLLDDRRHLDAREGGLAAVGRVERREAHQPVHALLRRDRKSTRLNSSHANISYAVFCLKKKKTYYT